MSVTLTNGSFGKCPKCGQPLEYYDGCLGYEAARCEPCNYERDLNKPIKTRGKRAGDTLSQLGKAIARGQAAVVGDSSDEEHDALVSIVSLFAGEVPDCQCDEYSWHGEGHASACPSKAWESSELDAKPLMAQLLKRWFPWLGTDEEASGAETVELLSLLYQRLMKKAGGQ